MLLSCEAVITYANMCAKLLMLISTGISSCRCLYCILNVKKKIHSHIILLIFLYLLLYFYIYTEPIKNVTMFSKCCLHWYYYYDISYDVKYFTQRSNENVDYLSILFQWCGNKSKLAISIYLLIKKNGTGGILRWDSKIFCIIG